MSTAVTRHPRSASQIASAPSPHPASSADPGSGRWSPRDVRVRPTSPRSSALACASGTPSSPLELVRHHASVPRPAGVVAGGSVDSDRRSASAANMLPNGKLSDGRPTLDAMGPRLKRLRPRREIALTDLAAETGISTSTLSRLEAGCASHAGATAPARPRLRGNPRRARRRAADRQPTHQPASHRRRRRVDRHPADPPSRGIQAYKFVLPAGRDDAEPELRTHEGYDWVYVLDGTLRLVLGEHDLILKRGGRRVRHAHPALVRGHQRRPRRVPQPHRQAGRTRARPGRPAE